jgi:hypothetical protein
MADPPNAKPKTTERDAAPASSRPDPLVGRVIEGRFEILEPLARGGMGAVYKARQLPLERICAVKVLSVSYDPDADPLFQKRFFREASVAAKLTHPNTVRIFDYGQTTDGIYFIAMEYLEGRTLFRLLRDEGPLDEGRASHIAKQICRSLREAHEHGVVHRDLKPGNVLIVERPDEKYGVKVLDFGLVKDIAEHTQVTQAGLRMGSPKYMAPEQARGDTISARTDIYSLGVLLYEMLTGRPPFDKKQPALTAMAQVNDPVPPLSSVRPGLDLLPGLEDIVLRCLEKDPARRFQRMQDMLDALKAVVADETGENARPSFLPAPVEPGPVSGAVVASKASSLPPAAALPPLPAPAEALPPPAAPPPPAARLRPRAPWLAAIVGASIGIGGAALATRPQEVPAASASAAPAPSAPSAAIVGAQTILPTPSAAVPTVYVRLESEPPGALVADGERRVCEATPCDVAHGEIVGHKLVFDRAGYYAALVEIAPATDRVFVRLSPVAVAAKPGSAAPAAAASGAYKPMPY